MFCFTRCQAYLILRAINSTTMRELGACQMADSFITTNRFFDNKHYPRGFSRHGDFTIKEAQLLERHGYAFNELDSGKREPVTEEEQRFVAVCRGEREPVSAEEKVWSKYVTGLVSLNVSIPCLAVSHRWMLWRIIPIATINLPAYLKLQGC